MSNTDFTLSLCQTQASPKPSGPPNLCAAQAGLLCLYTGSSHWPEEHAAWCPVLLSARCCLLWRMPGEATSSVPRGGGSAESVRGDAWHLCGAQWGATKETTEPPAPPLCCTSSKQNVLRSLCSERLGLGSSILRGGLRHFCCISVCS